MTSTTLEISPENQALLEKLTTLYPNVDHSTVKTVCYTDLASFLSVATFALNQRQWANATPLSILPSYLTRQPPINLWAPPPTSSSPSPSFLLYTTHSISLLKSSSSLSTPILIATRNPTLPYFTLYTSHHPTSIPPQILTPHLLSLLSTLLRTTSPIPLLYNSHPYLLQPLRFLLTPLLSPTYTPTPQKHAAVIAACLTASSFTPYFHATPTLPSGHKVIRIKEPSKQLFRELCKFHGDMFLEAHGLDRRVDAESNEMQIQRDIEMGFVWGYFIGVEEGKEGELQAAAYNGRPTKDGCVVRVLYTKLESRGKGFARALMKEMAERLLVDDGGKGAELSYLGILYFEGGHAGKLYERLGWGRGGEEGERFGGTWKSDEVVYVKSE